MNNALFKRKTPILLLLLALAVLVWSAIHPRQPLNWFMEVLPPLIELVILIVTYRWFQFTTFSYVLLFIHIVLPFIGGHYTYSHVPLFDWIREQFGFTRNHYDRFVHFSQGFVAALLIREILIRLSPVKKGFWLFVTIISIIALNSNLYELVEFASAKVMGGSAEEFLGLQGDFWDTQWDMTMALAGSLLGLALLWRAHDRALGRHMLASRFADQ